MQFSKLLTFVEDNDIASTPYNKKERQYDFKNSTNSGNIYLLS